MCCDSNSPFFPEIQRLRSIFPVFINNRKIKNPTSFFSLNNVKYKNETKLIFLLYLWHYNFNKLPCFCIDMETLKSYLNWLLQLRAVASNYFTTILMTKLFTAFTINGFKFYIDLLSECLKLIVNTSGPSATILF